MISCTDAAPSSNDFLAFLVASTPNNPEMEHRKIAEPGARILISRISNSGAVAVLFVIDAVKTRSRNQEGNA